MVTNGMLIATFILKTKILSFIEFLRNDFKIKTDRIYVYEIEENDDEYLVKVSLRERHQYMLRMAVYFLLMRLIH